MRDTAKQIRAGVYHLLNSNLGGIKVYDEKRAVTASDKTYVLLSTQQETPSNDNDSTWITRSAIDIEIVQRTNSEVTKDGIDDIANAIMTILIPVPWTTPLAASNLQIQLPFIESTISRNVSVTDTESILTKTVRFVCTITQQTN